MFVIHSLKREKERREREEKREKGEEKSDGCDLLSSVRVVLIFVSSALALFSLSLLAPNASLHSPISITSFSPIHPGPPLSSTCLWNSIYKSPIKSTCHTNFILHFQCLLTTLFYLKMCESIKCEKKMQVSKWERVRRVSGKTRTYIGKRSWGRERRGTRDHSFSLRQSPSQFHFNPGLLSSFSLLLKPLDCIAQLDKIHLTGVGEERGQLDSFSPIPKKGGDGERRKTAKRGNWFAHGGGSRNLTLSCFLQPWGCAVIKDLFFQQRINNGSFLPLFSQYYMKEGKLRNGGNKSKEKVKGKVESDEDGREGEKLLPSRLCASFCVGGSLACGWRHSSSLDTMQSPPSPLFVCIFHIASWNFLPQLHHHHSH